MNNKKGPEFKDVIPPWVKVNLSKSGRLKKWVRRNYWRNGVEIIFDRKPVDYVRDDLKQNKWRWNPYYGIWYKRYTLNNLEFARSL